MIIAKMIIDYAQDIAQPAEIAPLSTIDLVVDIQVNR